MNAVISTLHVKPEYNPSQEVYVHGLLSGLAQCAPRDARITVLVTPRNRALFPLDAFEAVECNPPASASRRILWEQKNLPPLLDKLGAAVYHGTGNMMAFKWRGPQAVTVHLAMEFKVTGGLRHTAQIAWRKWIIHRTAHRAHAVICASQYLKDGLRRVHALPHADHIHVVPMGVDQSLFHPLPDDAEDRETLSRLSINGPFFFGYADILGLKNVPRILVAWEQLRRQPQCPPVKLVLMGDPASRNFVRRELAALGPLERDVIFPGFVTRRDLAALYRGALALVFPSLAESFGLCIIEAMACGAPVITSNVTAMPEVAGSAALLVDPTDTNQIRDAMGLVARDEDARARLAAASRVRARDFSWENTARRTLDIYSQLAARQQSS
jgi:glycosyltransferase involved in cell wall biosynthesis